MPAALVKGGDDGEKGRSSSQPAKKNRNYYFNSKSNVKVLNLFFIIFCSLGPALGGSKNLAKHLA
jgi:hypothetical protein